MGKISQMVSLIGKFSIHAKQETVNRYHHQSVNDIQKYADQRWIPQRILMRLRTAEEIKRALCPNLEDDNDDQDEVRHRLARYISPLQLMMTMMKMKIKLIMMMMRMMLSMGRPGVSFPAEPFLASPTLTASQWPLCIYRFPICNFVFVVFHVFYFSSF